MNRLNLDFRSKFIFTVVISFVLLLGYFPGKYLFIRAALVSIPYILIWTETSFVYVVKNLAILLLVLLLNIYSKDIAEISKWLAIVTIMITEFMFRMMPVVMMGKYNIISTSISDLIHALQLWKIPDAIIIPIAVMFRFFYTITQDYKIVKDSMKMRGIDMGFLLKHPAKYIEFTVVPLLMGISNTADDVAVSAMTKGLVPGNRRSSISTTKIKFNDYVLIGISIITVIIYIRSNHA